MGSEKTNDDFTVPEDEFEYMDAKIIVEGIKIVARIARARAIHFPVSSEDLLPLPNVQGGETGKFSMDDNMQFWSLIDYLKFDSVHSLRPELQSMIISKDDTKEKLQNQYRITDPDHREILERSWNSIVYM